MSKSETVATQKEFITLEVSQVGFVVYGLGGGANKCVFHGVKLMKYLEGLWEKMWNLKKELNTMWVVLDKKNSDNPINRGIIEKFLYVGAWAYALSVELKPFSEDCRHGPTDPLGHIFLQRLEEIFTKCFIAVHMYGNMDESIVGRRGIFTDFELNGGINVNNGTTGYGFEYSILIYFLAHFAPNERTPIVYQKYAEFMEELSKLIETCYPKCSAAFSVEINRLIQSRDRGFGSKEITSPAKDILLAKLAGIASRHLSLGKSQKDLVEQKVA